jgi:hypothetical protein
LNYGDTISTQAELLSWFTIGGNPLKELGRSLWNEGTRSLRNELQWGYNVPYIKEANTHYYYIELK